MPVVNMTKLANSKIKIWTDVLDTKKNKKSKAVSLAL